MASHEVHLKLKHVREYFEKNAQGLLGILLKNSNDESKVKHSKRKKRRMHSTSVYGGRLAQTYHNDISESLDALYLALQKLSYAIDDFEDYRDQEGAAALDRFLIEIRVPFQQYIVLDVSNHAHRYYRKALRILVCVHPGLFSTTAND